MRLDYNGIDPTADVLGEAEPVERVADANLSAPERAVTYHAISNFLLYHHMKVMKYT